MECLDDVKIQYTQLFINNEWVDASSGKTFSTINPATLDKVADIQEADKADVDKAVAAARAAFKLGSPWRKMGPKKRAELLNKLADLFERDRRQLAGLETMDNGKPFKMSYGGVSFDMELARYAAGAADKISGETLPSGTPSSHLPRWQPEKVVCTISYGPLVARSLDIVELEVEDDGLFMYTRMEPIGVCALIIPWNRPISMFVQKAAPALAAGCTIVVKPAEQTPLSCLYMAQLFKEAGFPPGVVNVLPGYGPTAGAALSAHMDVDMVTFTGSVEVGKLIMQASGRSNLKKVTLELGGKSPNIVFADVDMDSAVEISHQAIMANMGQVCCGASRTFVHEDIYDEFVKRSAERAKRRTVGNPLDPKNENGPQVDEDQVNKVMELIESGIQEGATLQAGGKRAEGKGYFVQPTVFSDVTPDMRIAREEIFGPVQSIFKFKTIDEAIEKANNTTYGLAATVLTKDINKALTIANSVAAGTVWVNTTNNNSANAPFGGYKMSGLGRERGKFGIEEYCEIKTVIVKIASTL